VVVWGSLGVIAAFTVARLLGFTDRSPRPFALATLTPWLLAPTATLFAAALALRSRSLVLSALTVAIVIGVATAPDLRWWPAERAISAEGSFVVAAANIGATNDRRQEVAEALWALESDVLVVVELTPAAQEAIVSNGAIAGYPHRVEDPREGFYGSAIYSRYPIIDGDVISVAGSPMTRATIALPGGSATVIAVHTVQPLAGLDSLRSQLAALDELAESSSIPVILAGDFNATRQHGPFRELLDDGFTDAHLSTGRGWAATWPTGRRVPPFALLDRVIVSAAFTARHTSEVTVPGSDHKAVVAHLGWSAAA